MNELPSLNNIETIKYLQNFINEEISIKELDYYFSNSISRSSKTMSECRQIKQ